MFWCISPPVSLLYMRFLLFCWRAEGDWANWGEFKAKTLQASSHDGITGAVKADGLGAPDLHLGDHRPTDTWFRCLSVKREGKPTIKAMGFNGHFIVETQTRKHKKEGRTDARTRCAAHTGTPRVLHVGAHASQRPVGHAWEQRLQEETPRTPV